MLLPLPTNPEAGFAYRWLADDPVRLSRHVSGMDNSPGYGVVGDGMPRAEVLKLATKLGYSTQIVDVSGRIRCGRCILGAIPLASKQARVRERADELADRLSPIHLEERAAAITERTGGKVRGRVDQAGNFADRKAFATRESNNRTSFAGLDARPSSLDEAAQP